MSSVTLEDALRRLPELIEAATRGEVVVITRPDQTAVKLVPVEQPRPGSRFGCARDSILYMADDFDAPLEDFEEYMIP